jgi:hypothetical protein
MFQLGEWLLDLIIGVLDFGEVDEAMFQGFFRSCELIFFILVIEKSELDKIT